VRRHADPEIRLLQAASDPTRLAILRQLAAAGPVCACDIAAGYDVAQPTVSHHLRVLREAGWIEGERRGTWIWYRLRPEARDQYDAIGRGLAPAARLTTTHDRLTPSRSATAGRPTA
jgi:ArsR family transcriptional regulator, arsenate/arsenite/antimonite-responsive transcriptional repressor